MSCTAWASLAFASSMSMPGMFGSILCDCGAGEVGDCCDSWGCTPGVWWRGMAASRTVTTKSAPTRMLNFVASWMSWLRAGIKILLSEYYVVRGREVSKRGTASAAGKTGRGYRAQGGSLGAEGK